MAARDIASLLGLLLVLSLTWGAWAAVDVNMEDKVEVFRGETAQITCMFTSSDGVGGMIIQWFYVTQTGEKQRIFFQDPTMNLVDRDTPFTERITVNGSAATNVSALTIKDVKIQDELEFICLIKGLTDGTGEGRTKLKVFQKPDLPTIEGVETGISVNEDSPSKIGTCEVKNGYPRPTIMWYRNDTPLHGQADVIVRPSSTSESSGLFSARSELSMMVTREDENNWFYCEINYDVPGGTRMTETQRIQVTVYYPSTAVKVWVESPKGKIKEGDRVELHCSGNGNQPSSIFAISAQTPAGEVSSDSNTLVLENVTRLHNGVYTCTSTDTDTFEDITGNTTVEVNYLDHAVVIPEDAVEVDQGEELTATCNALSSLQTQTVWFKDAQEVSRGHILSVKDATYDTAGTYMCVITVPGMEEMETRGTLNAYVRGPPEILEQEYTEMETSFDNTVELICTVRGFPLPDVVWTTSDGKILNPDPPVEDKDKVLSVISLKVTSDITAFCNASNELGAAAVTYNIKAITNTTTPAITTTSTTSSTISSTEVIIETTTANNTTSTTNSDISWTEVINTTTPANTTNIPTDTTDLPNTVKAETAIPPKKIKKEGNGVVIAVIIICILLLAILGSVLYFLYKKGKICGRSGKQDLTKEKTSKDNIVVEMKSDNTEEAVLLGVNGEKQPPNDQ